MKKIDVLIHSFSDFGAQRVAINVANCLQGDYIIRFVVFDDSGPFKNYLDPQIKIIKLDYGILNIPKIRLITRFLRYYIEAKNNKTEIAISFSPIANLVILFVKFFKRNLKTIIQEHAFPSLAVNDKQNMNIILKWFFVNIFFRFYNFSNIFICISKAIKDDFIENFGIKEEIIKIVRNPIDIKGILNKINQEIDFVFDDKKKYIISIGRLVEQKNFFKLLRIFKKVKQQIPQTELLILGDGPDKQKLLSYAKEIKIEPFVHFLGFQLNPYAFLNKADCYCLTSNWEGLPQVIAEAMICKTPIVANDCPSGPSEMIIDNKTGFLIPINNEELFVDKVVQLLNNKELKEKISNNAFKFANQEYSLEKCFLNYKNIIESI